MVLTGGASISILFSWKIPERFDKSDTFLKLSKQELHRLPLMQPQGTYLKHHVP